MAAWKNWLSSRPFEWQFQPPQAGVESLRQQLLALVDDCAGLACDRLRWRLHTAECGQDLWLLRDAVFQVIATQHCQAQALERINRLAPAFQQLLPRHVAASV